MSNNIKMPPSAETLFQRFISPNALTKINVIYRCRNIAAVSIAIIAFRQ